MNETVLFNMIAMATLIVMGIIFIGQGIYYVYQQKRDVLPDKLYVIGVTNIIVGVFAFGFATMYALM
jgi:hypothetical protein